MHKFWSNPIYFYLFFYFVACTSGGIFKKSLLNPRSWRFTSMFPSKSFILLAPTFRCLIHFGLFFCICYEMQAHVAIQCPSTICDCLCVCVCVCVWLSFRLVRKKEDVKTKKYIKIYIFLHLSMLLLLPVFFISSWGFELLASDLSFWPEGLLLAFLVYDFFFFIDILFHETLSCGFF